MTTSDHFLILAALALVGLAVYQTSRARAHAGGSVPAGPPRYTGTNDFPGVDGSNAFELWSRYGSGGD